MMILLGLRLAGKLLYMLRSESVTWGFDADSWYPGLLKTVFSID